MMTETCTSLYPIVALAVVIILLAGFAIRERRQVGRNRNSEFDRHGRVLLLALLGVGLVSMAIFVFYLVGPQMHC
jgi:type II secretory pathway pseudopilin PulG